ncbi:MAG: aminotransferase class III-fold pyridoxal phosphate-dependent enzyme, partial [Tenericutes bacterium]|nr:aminotransferase class III-fold pyridoxal phosphate-dependent enzyme [Mycoplasmatota bacterium]
LDIWKPAEHNGTFRGNQLAFVGAKEAIKLNIELNLNNEVQRKGEIVKEIIEKEILPIDSKLTYRGIGLIWGIDFSNFENEGLSKIVANKCFEKGLIIERAGRKDVVLKILPPLIIKDEELINGLNIIKEAIKEVLN